MQGLSRELQMILWLLRVNSGMLITLERNILEKPSFASTASENRLRRARAEKMKLSGFGAARMGIRLARSKA